MLKSGVINGFLGKSIGGVTVQRASQMFHHVLSKADEACAQVDEYSRAGKLCDVVNLPVRNSLRLCSVKY